MDKAKVFLASAIDEDKSRGMDVRRKFGELIEGCGCEVLGAGLAGNPIIETTAPRAACKAIIRQDLMEQSNAHVTLAVTNGETLAAGTWIEVWEGYKLCQFVILFVEGGKKVRSIFLKGIVDEIIYNDLDRLKVLLREV